MGDKTHIYARIFSGNYSSEDMAWYESEKDLRPLEVEQYRIVWELTSTYQYPVLTTTEDSWEALKTKKVISSKPHFIFYKNNIFKWSVAAALVVGMISFFYLFNQPSVVAGAIYTEVFEAKKGSINKVNLEDGTVVTLNSGSTLKVDENYNSTARRVLLKGEAYFEVAPNASIPFIVSAGNHNITVVGTEFNISNFNESTFFVSVKSGSVKVESPSAKIQLYKGQKAFENSIHTLEVLNLQDESDFAWINGDFSFENTLFSDVIAEVERHFNVNLVYDKSLNTKKYTGTFKNKSLEEVIEVLEIVFKTKISQSSAVAN